MITPFRSALKFGTPLSLILFTQFYFVTRVTIEEKMILSSWISVLQWAIIFLAVLLSCADHLKKFSSRIMKVSEGIGCGVITTAWAGILFGFMLFIYLIFNPVVIDTLTEISRKAMGDKAPVNPIHLTHFQQSLLASVHGFINTFLVGFISSLFAGFITSKFIQKSVKL